jgi:putative transposase
MAGLLNLMRLKEKGMRRTKSAIFLHFVWGTWDRLPLLVDEKETLANRVIGDKCLELGAEIVALGGVEDHVHLLVCLPTTLSAADFMKHVKGASAHLIAQKYAPDFFRWQGIYGVFSVSLNDISTVTAYIHQQRQHHRLGSTVDDWEIPSQANTEEAGT